MAQTQCSIGPEAAAPPPAEAEVPRRPALSPSRANDFKQCPLLYRFRAIDRLPEVPTSAQARGTLVHAVLEQLFLLPAQERTPQAARALVAPVWERLCVDDPRLLSAVIGDERDGSAGTSNAGRPGRTGAADAVAQTFEQTAAPTEAAAPTHEKTAATAEAAPTPAEAAAIAEAVAPTPTETAGATEAVTGAIVDEAPAAPTPATAAGLETWLEGAAPMLDAYFALEDPRLLEPEARELRVEVELESGLLLRGYIDRVDRIGTDGAALRVVDYKTGSAPRPVAEARALFQMKFYALALLRLRGVMPAELRLMYLTGPEELRYIPDEGELRRFARILEAIWAAIRIAGTSGDFRPSPGPSCGWCGYKKQCPAWDGTPPPYPGWPADTESPAAREGTTDDL